MKRAHWTALTGLATALVVGTALLALQIAPAPSQAMATPVKTHWEADECRRAWQYVLWLADRDSGDDALASALRDTARTYDIPVGDYAECYISLKDAGNHGDVFKVQG